MSNFVENNTRPAPERGRGKEVRKMDKETVKSILHKQLELLSLLSIKSAEAGDADWLVAMSRAMVEVTSTIISAEFESYCNDPSKS